MGDTTYNEDEIIRAQLSRWLYKHYMTDIERRCWYLGARRARSEADPSSGWSERIRVEWDVHADKEVREALAQGVAAFEQAIFDRLWRQYLEGSLPLNRCPRCLRIVRTPLAKQCLWCGHDWHNA
jgi:hypothetical protein